MNNGLTWLTIRSSLLLAVFVVSVNAQPDRTRFGSLFVAAESPTARLTTRTDEAVAGTIRTLRETSLPSAGLLVILEV